MRRPRCSATGPLDPKVSFGKHRSREPFALDIVAVDEATLRHIGRKPSRVLRPAESPPTPVTTRGLRSPS